MLRCPKRVWFRHSLVFRCSRVLFNFNVSQTSLYSLIIAFFSLFSHFPPPPSLPPFFFFFFLIRKRRTLLIRLKHDPSIFWLTTKSSVSLYLSFGCPPFPSSPPLSLSLSLSFARFFSSLLVIVSFHSLFSPLLPPPRHCSFRYSMPALVQIPRVSSSVINENPVDIATSDDARATGQFHYWEKHRANISGGEKGRGVEKRVDDYQRVDPDEREEVPRTRGIGSCLKSKETMHGSKNRQVTKLWSMAERGGERRGGKGGGIIDREIRWDYFVLVILDRRRSSRSFFLNP